MVAFDKTGTVTVGKPAVTEFWTPSGVDANRVLRLAALIEKRSEHPLGAPVIEEALRRGIALPEEPIRDFHSHTGLGVHGRIAGDWVGIGREGLFEEHGVPIPPELIAEASRMRAAGQTALLIVVLEGEKKAVGGVVSVADAIRPESAGTIRALKQLGIAKVVMLTGDHERVARSVAAQIGADEYRAGLLPDQKVRELQKLSRTGGIAMVGDGVNDAPALAVARVGIAMGGAGADVALEVADVVLMSDDLRALPFAVAVSRLACRRVRQNMIFAFGMIAVLVLATFFHLPLWLGVVGHEGSTLLVVLNGLRILSEPGLAPSSS
jgi:Cd2+/Zn2+-exporting ATPase